MVETIEENPRGPEQFSFQDEVDALKIFGPIALKKNIETGHHRGNQPSMNKRAGGQQNAYRYNHVSYNDRKLRKNQVQVKLPNHVATKPSTASLELDSAGSSFHEVTEAEGRSKKRRHHQLVLSPWDDTAAKKAIHQMKEKIGKYNYYRGSPSPPKTNNPIGQI